jgi:hypothetical protein
MCCRLLYDAVRLTNRLICNIGLYQPTIQRIIIMQMINNIHQCMARQWTDGTALGSETGARTRAMNEAQWVSTGFLAGHWKGYLSKPRKTTPAATRRIPNHSLSVGHSCRGIAAKTPTNKKLNLSTGTTFDPSPTFKVRKEQTHDAPVASPDNTQKSQVFDRSARRLRLLLDEIYCPRQGDHAYRGLPSPAHHDRRAGER